MDASDPPMPGPRRASRRASAPARAAGAIATQSTTMVALLVWTYQRQKADVMSGKGLWTPEARTESGEEPKRWSGCGCAQLEAVAALGARVQPGGWQRPALHPDAELVHDSLVELSRADWLGAMLLRRHARQGGAPDWSEGRQEFEPERDARDRIVQDRYDEVVTVIDQRGRERAIPVLYCPLRKYPDDSWIEMTRGEYRNWHRALGLLAERLAEAGPRRLVRWRVAGLGAEAEPWLRADLPHS